MLQQTALHRDGYHDSLRFGVAAAAAITLVRGKCRGVAVGDDGGSLQLTLFQTRPTDPCRRTPPHAARRHLRRRRRRLPARPAPGLHGGRRCAGSAGASALRGLPGRSRCRRRVRTAQRRSPCVALACRHGPTRRGPVPEWAENANQAYSGRVVLKNAVYPTDGWKPRPIWRGLRLGRRRHSRQCSHMLSGTKQCNIIQALSWVS